MTYALAKNQTRLIFFRRSRTSIQTIAIHSWNDIEVLRFHNVLFGCDTTVVKSVRT